MEGRRRSGTRQRRRAGAAGRERRGSLRRTRHDAHARDAAVLGERRRIARELHDGLAQELAFIKLEALTLAERSGDPGAERLVDAAERALAESRHAIEELSEPFDRSFAEAAYETARRLGERSQARITVVGEQVGEPSPEARRALLRILREAIWNGLRHGGATAFKIEFARGSGILMRIEDDGRGFEPQVVARGRGLDGMAERARALGGRFEVRSWPGGRTVVEVVLP